MLEGDLSNELEQCTQCSLPGFWIHLFVKARKMEGPRAYSRYMGGSARANTDRIILVNFLQVVIYLALLANI